MPATNSSPLDISLWDPFAEGLALFCQYIGYDEDCIADTPAGWTLLDSYAAQGHRQMIFGRIADGAEGDTLSLDIPGFEGTDKFATVATMTNVASLDVVSAEHSDEAAGTDVLHPTVAVPSQSLVIAFAWIAEDQADLTIYTYTEAVGGEWTHGLDHDIDDIGRLNIQHAAVASEISGGEFNFAVGPSDWIVTALAFEDAGADDTFCGNGCDHQHHASDVVLDDGQTVQEWFEGVGGGVADILDLPTAETDDTLVLAPDGAGGVEWVAPTGGAPTAADYLVGTAQGGLSAEIVVGTTPGGELGNTWASPTVDATHSGSTHSAATDTHIADTSAAHVASSIGFTPNGSIAATDVQAAIQEVRDEASGSGIPASIVDAKGDLIVATAADTVARLAVGATNGHVLTVDSGETTGLKYAAAGGGSLSYQRNQLSADVTMTNANTYYDGPSVTLSAGTWLIIAGLVFKRDGAAYAFTVKLWDGTTVAASRQADQDAGFYNSIEVNDVIVIASGTPTWKVSAACGGAGAVMYQAAPSNGAGNNASGIVAVKIA